MSAKRCCPHGRDWHCENGYVATDDEPGPMICTHCLLDRATGFEHEYAYEAAPRREPDRLAQLIEEARALDGKIVGNGAAPFDFAAWLSGVNAGIEDAAKRAGPKQGRLA